MTFRVGQKVVKVSAFPEVKGNPRTPNLTNGSIYTIRDIDYRAVHLHGIPTIRLEEVVGLIMPNTVVGEWECGYSPKNFRPIVERKTDISIFTSMLNPSKVDA